MLKLSEGDRVRIADRAAVPADVKSGLFYNHYRNVTGSVFKVYGKGETAQAAVEVDVVTLPPEIAKRHEETRCAMLASLYGEGRRRNASQEEAFHLRYIALVSVSDLQRVRKPALIPNSLP